MSRSPVLVLRPSSFGDWLVADDRKALHLMAGVWQVTPDDLDRVTAVCAGYGYHVEVPEEYLEEITIAA